MGKSDIIDRIVNKDENTISNFYIDVKKPYINFIKKYAGVDQSEAMELFQESFYIMYCKLKNGDLKMEIPDLRRYLFGIGKNLVQNNYKHHQKTIRDAFNYSDAADNTFEELDTILENDTKQEIIRMAVNALTDPCKSILNMFYWKDMQYDEMLNVIPNFSTTDSLKAQKYKCMHRLSETLLRIFSRLGLE